MRLLVTGGNGFVGRALCQLASERGYETTALVRQPSSLPVREWVHQRRDFVSIDAEWPNDLRCEVVVHLAARVHEMDGGERAGLERYRDTNVAGSLRVARAAAERGCRRFVYVSSIKVMGEVDHGVPFDESMVPRPVDAYGISKLEAETTLRDLGHQTGMEVVCVRPPLIYGPGVRANFLRLVDAIAKGVPLPLGDANAQRSMVFVDNFVDALCLVASSERILSPAYHVTDGEDVSVRQLVIDIGRCLDVSPRLLPVPIGLLKMGARLFGRDELVQRLVSSLRVNGDLIRAELGWEPPLSRLEGLRQTIDWYRANLGRG
ncbi:NAD-dependent epimerase/dehydratase [Burkholderia multivorans]|uniref:UDP-glucose 4-epimerase family protein n=1 Tax=Burkholderia multivorans TaxID=87883 RepID=UPI0006A5EA84|nr:SDR family oxidoreductase [Burkholderia multivorans]KOE25714.1 NAD-dependent dehydratase [Burkholderia multivorans R-20526]MBU9242316.1 SDR family oxidoreductase [Burkholderia multivorans]MCO7333102.1 SDR family oxidoreductase [Burkholderia multivorans]MCO7339517.1 SDR family oxidoreductase [Burkholderia multivorans]MCO7345583.1 SDR family oxidoreductase [Burkholderia multivorans]